MVLSFNKKDLTLFGEYLLSDERKSLIEQSESSEPIEQKVKKVHQSDYENWLLKMKQRKSK
jgi:antibiotic biosynthesis monooxygenase (ABM) superfamily enzyme